MARFRAVRQVPTVGSADKTTPPAPIFTRTVPDYWRHDVPKPELGDIIEILTGLVGSVTYVFTGSKFVADDPDLTRSPGAASIHGWREPVSKDGATT